MKLYFITANPKKYEEASEILKEFGINVKHIDYDYAEIQSSKIGEKSLEEVLLHAMKNELRVLEESKKIDAPYFIDDSGLFIEALRGFPGVYSSYVYKTIGNKGILKLMHGKKNRRAEFICGIALNEGKGEIKIFKGVCRGVIANKERGSSGFGYDPIFMPEKSSKTFAEDKYLKNKLSHRRRAIEKLADYIKIRKS